MVVVEDVLVVVVVVVLAVVVVGTDFGRSGLWEVGTYTGMSLHNLSSFEPEITSYG